MTAMYEHPSLKMHVTPEQRDRAEDWLKEAYADGRISETEFDSRIGQVLSADNRKELNEAFYGLVHVPAPSQAVGVHQAYPPSVRPEAGDRGGRVVGAFAHFASLPFWLFAPALVYAVSTPGSTSRREAAKAFNFGLVMFLGMVVTQVAQSATGLDVFDMLTGLLMVSWVVLTVIAGAKAAQGQDWKNPVRNVVKLQVLSEK